MKTLKIKWIPESTVPVALSMGSGAARRDGLSGDDCREPDGKLATKVIIISDGGEVSTLQLHI